MPFPDRWVQLWLDLPRTNVGASYPYVTSLHWFAQDIPVDPATYDFYLAANALIPWIVNGVGGLAVCEAAHPYAPSASVYFKGGGYTEHVGVSFGPHYPFGDARPGSQNVIIRRYTSGFGPRKQGRFYMGPVDDAYMSGDSLTLGALATWQARADTMTTPVVYDGVTFTPSLASYVDSTLTPITRFEVMQGIGFVKRRQRHRIRLGPGPLSGPKIPPP